LPQFIQGILASQEFFDLAGRDPSTFVRNVYDLVLNRPAALSDVNFWISQAAQARQDIRVFMPQSVMSSPEELRHLIDQNYMRYLRRFPDTPSDFGRPIRQGLPYAAQGFLNALPAGTDLRDVVTALLASPEYVGLARSKAFYTGSGRWKDDQAAGG